MAKEYLDKTGLAYLWGKLKSHFAPLASPALTGTPTAPTAATGTSNTQIATTQFVADAINNNQSYKSGDTFSSRTWRAMGRSINSGKGIYCWIDFGKPITASGATFSIGSINAYYYNEATTPTFAKTVSSVTISGNELLFFLDTTNTLTAGKVYLIELNSTAITLT